MRVAPTPYPTPPSAETLISHKCFRTANHKKKNMQEEAVTASAMGVKFGPVIAGLIGAILSMRAIADAPLINRITSMLSASGAAGYLTPAICEWTGLTSQHMQNAVGFFVGLLILNFTAGLITLSSEFAKDPVGATRDLMDLLFRWRTGSFKNVQGDPND